MTSQDTPAIPFKNNFDLMRLLAALVVFCVHSYNLSGDVRLSFMGHFLNSSVALNCFFVISGFLVFSSFERSSSLADYFKKRVRRIYPAYFTVIVLLAVLGAFISDLSIGEYFGLSLVKYLLAQLSLLNFLEHGLPGVFSGNRYGAVNGALWSIRIEVICYILTPVIAMLAVKTRKLFVLAPLYLCAVASYFILIKVGERMESELIRVVAFELPWQLAFYISGAIIYYHFDFFKDKALPLFVTAIAVYLISPYLGIDVFLKPISLGVIVIFLGFSLPYLGNFARYGDFSYGIYIIHYPVLQVLVWWGLFAVSPLMGFVVATVVILLLSSLCWHLVEKRFLKRSSHYIMVVKDKG